MSELWTSGRVRTGSAADAADSLLGRLGRARARRTLSPFAGHDPYKDNTSVRHRFRAERFGHVSRLIEAAIKERGFAHVLDLGGTETYWRAGGDFIARNRERILITLINPQHQRVEDDDLFVAIAGDATDPRLLEGRVFDVVHSNSVIEHVGDWPKVRAFAENVRRLAPRYFVQTPNYWFPYEPHFLVPGFQYLPIPVRTALMLRFQLGFFPRLADWHEAREHVESHRLLAASELMRLFPDGVLHREKLFGLTKSLMAIRS